MTTQQPTQQDFLDAFQNNHAHFLKLINRLNEEQQQIAFTPSGWSVKDFLSHMSHWKAATLKLIVAYTHYQPLPPVTPSGDAANAEAREMDKELPLPKVRNYWEETHMHFTHVISDVLDDNKLQEEVRPPWDEGVTESLCSIVASICDHDEEHFELIEQYFEMGN
ncbi:MAG TPA: DinB family protein [Ktedonobacteraceae bacterium]|nr:DinB family protein [Ktedonobacteraceae bacterium]